MLKRIRLKGNSNTPKGNTEKRKEKAADIGSRGCHPQRSTAKRKSAGLPRMEETRTVN
jgi:hypothetical protein